MIFEAVVGVAREHLPPSGWLSNGLRPGHDRWREWLRRGLLCCRSVCPPDNVSTMVTRREASCQLLMVPVTDSVAEVMIPVDPHKACWTAVAVDRPQRWLATIRVHVRPDGYRRLRHFARAFPTPGGRWKAARGLGAPLTARLRADGLDVLDVPAKLARKVRKLSTGHGRKSDEADAYSVGVAALTAHRLNAEPTDDAVAPLGALTGHRDDLVRRSKCLLWSSSTR